MNDVDQRIADLQRQLDELKRTAGHREDGSSGEADSAQPVARRDLFRKAALGAAGAAVGAVGVSALKASPAAAANGDPLLLGTPAAPPNANTATAITEVRNVSDTADVRASFLFQSVGTTGTATTNADTPFLGLAALAGVANAVGTQTHGVTGWSRKSDGTGVGVLGFSPGIGGDFLGLRAQLRLTPGPTTSPTVSPLDDTVATVAHTAGELVFTTDGVLWLCVESGTPGEWTVLGGTAATPGSINLLTAPVRVYDSRTTSVGKLTNGNERTIDLAGTSPNLAVPAGASGAVIVLTLDQTVDAGFLTVYSAAVTTRPTASNINWFATDQIVATTTFTAVSSSAQVKVYAGGSTGSPAATHFLIDVVGWIA